ncbi:unnamed protein product [Hymenolepis diminuta]|uniref:DUF7041 domain-containing protein n=1 Tax=Hymenolepis diminuta TaxID=6216 RepID=A0A564YCT7_HYMDI|nr:unnamed protein product [Hymenolepis diminuta]
MSNEPVVNAVAAPITYHVFHPKNPYFWFRELENSFRVRCINKQKTVLQHAFSALATDVVSQVIDIINKALEGNPYNKFKRAVNDFPSDSQEKRPQTSYHLPQNTDKRRRKIPKPTAKPSQSATQRKSPIHQLLLRRKWESARINATKPISINTPTSSQDPSPSTKLQIINPKLQPSDLLKETLLRKLDI